MQAFRLKGNVDEFGKLVVSELVDLVPGEVEVIVLKPAGKEVRREQLVDSMPFQADELSQSSELEIFKDWMLSGIAPAVENFDADAAKWAYLKEKHNL